MRIEKKNLFYIIVCVILAMLAASTILWLRHAHNPTGHVPTNRIPQKITYTSDTPKTECSLCMAGKNTLIPAYKGQKNIAIISLHTFELSYVQLNRYDDQGRPVFKKGTNSTQIRTTGQDCFSTCISANADRGYATGTITLHSEETLDLAKAALYLCTDCLNYTLEQSWGDTPYGVGVVDFETLEIRLFEENVSAFTFGDYYISSKTKYNEDGGKSIDFMAFYCPPRYP